MSFTSSSIAASHVVKITNISREEDLELERQLKLLNKPSIKTIQVLQVNYCIIADQLEGDMYTAVNYFDSKFYYSIALSISLSINILRYIWCIFFLLI